MLGVEVIFLRAVVYSRRNAVGFGLIKPETVIKILAIKLYIRYMRSNIKNNQLIRSNKKVVMVEYRYRKMD